LEQAETAWHARGQGFKFLSTTSSYYPSSQGCSISDRGTPGHNSLEAPDFH
jgi:hypothetical protein